MRKGEGSFGLVFLVRNQVASVLGMIGLAGFLGNFFDLGWRGVLLDLIGIWDHYVRPFTHWLLELVIVLPIKALFDVTIVIPQQLRDYLAVGLIFYFSSDRANKWLWPHVQRIAREEAETAGQHADRTFDWKRLKRPPGLRYLRHAARVVFWPYYTVKLVVLMIIPGRADPLAHVGRIHCLLALAPLIYLGALLVANELFF